MLSRPPVLCLDLDQRKAGFPAGSAPIQRHSPWGMNVILSDSCQVHEFLAGIAQ
jgi:hypothetical protein